MTANELPLNQMKFSQTTARILKEDMQLFDKLNQFEDDCYHESGYCGRTNRMLWHIESYLKKRLTMVFTGYMTKELLKKESWGNVYDYFLEAMDDDENKKIKVTGLKDYYNKDSDDVLDHEVPCKVKFGVFKGKIDWIKKHPRNAKNDN